MRSNTDEWDLTCMEYSMKNMKAVIKHLIPILEAINGDERTPNLVAGAMQDVKEIGVFLAELDEAVHSMQCRKACEKVGQILDKNMKKEE